MTPIEAAVKAGEDRRMTSEHDGWTGRIMADDARAIITAFLEAAAEDEAVAQAIYENARKMVSGRPPWERLNVNDRYELGMRTTAIKQQEAAILALKGTVNG